MAILQGDISRAASAANRSNGSTPITFGRRIGAAGAALACLAPLVFAAMLSPDPAGHGTHQQFGWPACGMLMATGRPCPTCGMTTSWAHAAHGQWVMAFVTQPGGLMLCLLAAAGFWVALHTAVFGSRALDLALNLLQPKPLLLLAALLLGSWVYKLATWPAAPNNVTPAIPAVGALFGR